MNTTTASESRKASQIADGDTDQRGPPLPVRDLMAARGRNDVSHADAPHREFDVEGVEWVVRSLGATRAGVPGDEGATLLLLGFANPDRAEEIEREVLAAAGSLDDLEFDDLRELFARSRPFRDPGKPHRSGPK